jgi:hypothetical protein
VQKIYDLSGSVHRGYPHLSLTLSENEDERGAVVPPVRGVKRVVVWVVIRERDSRIQRATLGTADIKKPGFTGPFLLLSHFVNLYITYCFVIRNPVLYPPELRGQM